MRRVRASWCKAALIACLLAGCGPHDGAEHMSHGRFQDLRVFRPAGDPGSFVLLLSAEPGWNEPADAIAAALVKSGAMVVGIDYAQFKANLEADGAGCVFPDGDLENLSHFVQAYYRLNTYLRPIVAGLSSGAALTYAVLAQAPEEVFGGGLGVGFCPVLGVRKPLCRGSGLQFAVRSDGRGVDLEPKPQLGVPWSMVPGTDAAACAPARVREFGTLAPGVPGDVPAAVQAAFAGIVKQAGGQAVPRPPAGFRDLPIIEQPSALQDPKSDAVAIMLSGDGGWAGLDQGVAAELNARGIPVVGLDSLRYFWTARTPAGIGADLDRVIRYYLPHFAKHRAILIGYSQGADVLPFAVNRLPAATRADVALVALLGISPHALFEFHLSSWIADSDAGAATGPELKALAGLRVLCVYGADEDASPCTQLDPKAATIVKLAGGHHFDGNYAALADTVLTAVSP
jgi:type IV secretory pathway VirJ component